MNILIIDDDPEDIMLFCEAIEEILPSAVCVQEYSCENIDHVIEQLKSVSVIFVDGSMHPFGGVECLRRLRRILGSQSEVKIVAYSGGLSPTQTKDFNEQAVDDILIKAVSYEVLKQTLSKLLIDKYQLGMKSSS